MQNDIIIISIVGKRNSDSCYVNFDNGESLLLNLDIISKYLLIKGKTINADNISEILKAQHFIDVRKAAYRFASYKPRTEYQIRQKLKEKAYDDDEINFAVKFLLEFKLIDDENYAVTFIKNKANLKNYGANRIKLELKRAGIADNLIEDSINEYYPFENLLDIAKKAAAKKMKLLQNKPPEKQRNSLIQYLIRQGYDWSVIKRIISEE